MLSPFVYWGQTESTVSLRVFQKPEIDLDFNSLKFSADGYGAKGNTHYSFAIEFFEQIEPSESFYKVIDRDIEFVLLKRTSKLWPRLLKNVLKPAWLKVDFDKMEDESEEEKDVDDWQRTSQSSLRDAKDKNFGRRKKQELTPEEFRKVYLFMYNLFQLVGFTYVFAILTLRYSVEGPESMEGSYNIIGQVMKFLTLLSILEVLHPLLGYTKGSALFAALEVTYRTLAKLFRYPYYMLRVFGVDVKILTWLHHTVWIALYPMAFICEGVTFLRNVPYFDETQNYSINLPNWFNFSFSMPVVIRLYLLVGLFPLFCMAMTRMYRKRVIAVGPKKWKDSYGKDE